MTQKDYKNRFSFNDYMKKNFKLAKNEFPFLSEDELKILLIQEFNENIPQINILNHLKTS